MKNILKFFFFCLLAVSFTACEDIDKDPYEINIVDGPFGNFVRLDLSTSPVLDVTDITNTEFGGTLNTPSSNVASWDVKVRRVSGGSASDFVPFMTVTTFPAEFRANAANLSTALGLAIDDLLPGDRFDFEATSTGTDGSIAEFDNFGPNLQSGPGQAQAYRFATFISCPFIQADALGSYISTVTNFNSFPPGNTFEVSAGDGTGQIILENPYGGAFPDANTTYDVAVDVSPFGIATLDDDQFVFDTDLTGNAGFFDTRVTNGGGFVFSCAGAIVLTWDLDLTQMGSGGNFTFGSAFPFTAQKL